MSQPLQAELSRRERQIMDALYRLERATVGEIVRAMGDPPAYNSVRVILGILEQKGFVKRLRQGQRHVYRPVVPRTRAVKSAIDHLVATFFGGSAPRAVATFLDLSAARLDTDDLDELARMIERAKRQRRR